MEAWMTPMGETYPTRDRLRALGGLGAAAMTAALGGNLVAPGAAQAAEQPDIIVLVLNDARDGDQVALPKTMTHFGAQGVTFPNYFMTTPLCCPGRATLLTGLYPHHHGVYDNTDANHGGWLGFVRGGNRSRATGGLLQAAGYRTV